MRTLLGLFACSLLFALGYAGCTSENNSTQNAVSTTTGAGGSPNTNYNKGCNGNPNGECNAKGSNPETCECVDCAEAATCTNKCMNDGVCNHDAGEDCTCDDCYGKQGEDQGDNACPPFAVGCDGPDEEKDMCTLGKDCTCDVCAGDARCQTCDHNGSCVAYLEGCACDDCKNEERCGGSGPTSAASTAEASSAASTTAGAGGAGGAGSGAGGSPAGAGGAGSGAGGAGGAGGN